MRRDALASSWSVGRTPGRESRMSQGGTTTHRPRPKVVYLCLDPGISLVPRPGAAVHAVSMIEAMQGLGLEVVPVGAAELLRNGRRRGALAALPRGQRYVDVLRRLLVERPAVSERLRRLLATHAPDLVYERTSQLYDVGGEAACAAGVPLVLEVNAPLAWEGARFRDERLGALAARQERRAWRLARRVTAV